MNRLDPIEQGFEPPDSSFKDDVPSQYYQRKGLPSSQVLQPTELEQEGQEELHEHVEQEEHSNELSKKRIDFQTRKGELKIDFRNFDHIIKIAEKIVDDAIAPSANNKNNRIDLFQKSVSKYSEEFDQLRKTCHNLESSKVLIETGEQILEALITLREKISKEELENRLSKCQMDFSASEIAKYVQEFLITNRLNLSSILKNCERKVEYTLRNFQNCTLQEEIFRRIILCRVARKLMVQEKMQLAVQQLQGKNGFYIFEVLTRKRLSIENKIRLLDHSCKITKHIAKKLVKIEAKFRVGLNEPTRTIINDILNIDGLADVETDGTNTKEIAILSRKPKHTSLSEINQLALVDTSQTNPAFIPESKLSKRREGKIKANYNNKLRCLNENVDKLFGLVRDIEENYLSIKMKLERELTFAKGFIITYWPHLLESPFQIKGRRPKASQAKRETPFSDEGIDKLSAMANECLLTIQSKFNTLEYFQYNRLNL